MKEICTKFKRILVSQIVLHTAVEELIGGVEEENSLRKIPHRRRVGLHRFTRARYSPHTILHKTDFYQLIGSSPRVPPR